MTQESVRQPLYSPIPLAIIQDTIEDTPFDREVTASIVDALDELQLAFLQDRNLDLCSLRDRAARSRHLFVDEYPGVTTDQFSSLAFLTGEVARSYFRKHLPDLEPAEETIVRHVLTSYASHPGIDLTYEPEVTPVVTRVVPYDAIVEAEPGPWYPPRSVQHCQ
jgi:hypothetical protein